MPGATSVGPSSASRSSLRWTPTSVRHRAVPSSGSRPTRTPDLPALTTVSAGDRRVHLVAVEEVVRGHLVVPAQLAGARSRATTESVYRFGPGRLVPFGPLGRAGERRRVRDADVDDAPLLVDRRRVPGAAAGVDLGVAPQVALDGVEGPAHLAGRGVERVDDAAVAGRVDAAEADRAQSSRCTRSPTTIGWMSMPVVGVAVTSVDHRRGAVAAVERDDAGRAVERVHPLVVDGDAERTDVEAGRLGRPAAARRSRGRPRTRRPVPVAT